MKKYVIWLVLFSIIEIALALYLSYWREHFWNAISNKESIEFLKQIGIFTAAALCICFTAGISGYLSSLASIEWRRLLNDRAFAVREQQIENINQRIQEDCTVYPTLFFNLLFGVVKSFLYLLVFSISLLFSFSFWFLVIFAIYSLLGTILAKYIASPLIKLNYEQQRIEATYRNNLTLVNFKSCIFIMLGIATRKKYLTYFQQFYGQIGVILPILIIAPFYFNSAMTLGMLMRFNSLSSTLLDNMSYGINSFDSINTWLSCRRRLKEAAII